MGPATRTNESLRELAHRASAGIEVTLLWDKRDDTLSVLALDHSSGELLEIQPQHHEALDAFQHPYAYAYSLQ
jgi:hypothetical protein